MTLYSNPNHEVIYRIMELLPTVEEGLEHMIGQLEELRLEESAVLFQDVSEAISSIANNLVRLIPEQDGAETLQSTGQIREAIGAMIDGYEVSNLVLIYTALVNHLLPAFNVWRQHVEHLLGPSIMS